MDKDRMKGAANKAAGSIKETAGKALGDSKMKADGKTQKIKGKVQNTVGSAKDELRN